MRAIRLCAIILLSFDCQLSNSQTNFSAQQSVPVATGGTIVGYSPAPGTQLRKEILDFIRPYCERELHQSVIFKVFMLSVSGDRAMATLAPLQKNGRPIATVQRYLAVLSRANQTWRLETLRTNPNDAEVANAIKWFVSTVPPQSEVGLTSANGANQTEAQEKRSKDFDQREAELNRHAAELDQKAAEIEPRAAQINQSSSPPPQMATVRRPSSVATESPPVASSPQSLSNSSIVTTKSEAGGTDRNSTESQEPKYDEILPILTSDVITYFKLDDQVNTELKRFVLARSTGYQQKKKQLRDLAARIYNQTYSIKLGDLAGAEYEVAKKSFPITIGSNFAMVALDCWPPKTIKGIQFSSFPTATEPMLSGAEISNEILHLNVDEQTALQIENNSNSYEVLVYFKIKGVEKKEFTCLDSNGQRWKGTKPVIATTNNSVVVRNKDTNQVVLRKHY